MNRKIKKGDYGYIHNEKIRRTLVTIGLFALPVAAYIGALLVTGTNKNIITVVAMVGCLPGCRSLVNTIMMFTQKPMDPDHYRTIHEHEGNLTMVYESYLTSYEKSVFVECFAICGNRVVGYSSRIEGSGQFVEDHLKSIFRQNGCKYDVKVLKEMKPFLERLDYMNAHKEELEQAGSFTPDSRYPELSREELARHLILAVSL